MLAQSDVIARYLSDRVRAKARLTKPCDKFMECSAKFRTRVCGRETICVSAGHPGQETKSLATTS